MKIKAWAVTFGDYKEPRHIAVTAIGYQLAIYNTESSAKNAVWSGFGRKKVVPVEIRIVPPKRKTKSRSPLKKRT